MSEARNGVFPAPQKKLRKSVPLSREERKALTKWVAAFHTVVEAAEAIPGVNRQTLDRVLLVGSGTSETIDKIREAINVQA